MTAVGLGLIAAQVSPLGSTAAGDIFYLLAGITVLGAIATVTFRNPVYSRIWFGLSLLGTAGLFLFQGAQFLGVATIVVYAGAILVTFLFVLMLAQPKGQAAYDRLSWGAGLSAVTGAVLVGVLTLAIVGVFQHPTADSPGAGNRLARNTASRDSFAQHMAHFGAVLFGRYLVAIEVAGTLLLVALVGTVAIVERIRPRRVSWERRTAGAFGMKLAVMDELALLENYLIVGALLFGIGLVGFISRRNMIVMFLSAEMMLQGVSVSLVAWGRFHNDWGGQILVIFILTVAACEAAIALAVVLTLFHQSACSTFRSGNICAKKISRNASSAKSPQPVQPEPSWPQLTPAGVEPEPDLVELSTAAMFELTCRNTF